MHQMANEIVNVPLISTGVEVRFIELFAAKSSDISLKGSTVVDTALQMK